MSVEGRARTARRIALLCVLATGAAACASVWGFKDFDGTGVDDASADEGLVRPGAAIEAGDAPGNPVDARASDGSNADAAVRIDAEGRDGRARDAADGSDASGAGDAGDAADARNGGDAGDAGDAAAEATDALPCPAGYHDCAGVCSSNFSPNSCGPSSCLPCELPRDGLSVMCNGSACVGACPSTLTLCEGGAGVCVDVTSDPDHCGGCDDVCPRPASGGVATCGGSPPACGIRCDDRRTACPSTAPTACVDTSSDPENCGGCGVACPEGEGGVAPSCVDGGCL